MTWLLVAFLIAILVVGGLILFLVSHGKRGTSVLNIDKYRSDWMAIEQQLVKGQETSYHLAILNADKLLDQALKQRGFSGGTMGERMKSAKTSWSNANNTWTAHKLRNQIAHEQNVRISYDTVRRALAAFKQSLKDLGAI
ncbi:helix-turn-helix domain-containing protein [Candidatus Saccharibacteria bacterium]|nr:helix-turn-helix domain-containing protein [Candidatus Saccharibacteria bacterium]